MEKQPPPRPDTLINQNVALVDPTSQHIQYAYAERPKNSNPGTNIIYHELWLDTSNRPHRTGNTIDPRQKSITTVEEWDDTPSDPPPVYGSGILEEKRRQNDYKKPAIIGPTHLAYPRNEGWRPKGQKGKTENGRPRKLSDITIHGITDHLTKRITRKIK